MLISSFVIDIIMALDYIIFIKKISHRSLILIGSFRFLGDLFAWISNFNHSQFIMIIGAVIFVMNIAYLYKCFELSLSKRTKS